VKIVFKKHIQT